MARYWVGGSATWDATAGTKWALTSGGAGGQAVPTATDDVFFDAASGNVTVTVSGSRTALSMDFTGFTGTWTGTATPQVTVSGNCKFASGMTVSAVCAVLVFDAAASNLTSATRVLRGITISGASASLTLLDALTLGNTDLITLTQGTFDANDFAVSCAGFSSNNSNTRVLSMGNADWTLTRLNNVLWTTTTTTGLTFNKEGANIIIANAPNSTTAQQFLGGGLTFNGLTIPANSSKFILQLNSATFSTVAITLPAVVQIVTTGPITIGTASTWAGSAANRLQLFSSVPATAASIVCAAGNFNIANAFIRDITFSGGATFAATDSYDLKGNSGITITEPSGGGGRAVLVNNDSLVAA